MSNHLDPSSNLLNIETIQEIDNLDLSIMQKHYLRILAHCLQILKIINVDNSLEYQNENPLREWCDNQSKKFDDKKFSDLFYEQLESTSKKLSIFSKKSFIYIFLALIINLIKHYMIYFKKNTHFAPRRFRLYRYQFLLNAFK